MAVPEVTEKYFTRLAHLSLPAHAVRILGKTGFHVSSIGFGGYRVHHNSIEHARALRYALRNGINLVDTSSNYTNGGSELLIGNLLQEMIERDEIAREEVVVVSKVGYIQGQNLKLARENESLGHPFPEMVKYSEDCWHCIHPDFLQDQLSRSLERLHLPALDVYLLHNPEYFLSAQENQNGTELEDLRSEYYRRIQVAFEWMEEKVTEGKIKAYGVSSNTFPLPATDLAFTSLEKVFEIAEYVASKNYFQVIQFPFNLFETGACFERNQSSGEKTLLQLASEKEIASLTNRPLNAVTKSGMVRLASFRETKAAEVKTDFNRTQRKLSELEKRFKQQLLSKTPADISPKNLRQVFSLSEQLNTALQAFKNWEQWDQTKQIVIMPQVSSYLNYLNHVLQEDPAWKRWSEDYVNTLHEFLDVISRHYENQAQERSQEISTALDEAHKALQLSETLSQKTLRLLTSVPGVTCVLLGMRKTPYVEDALSAQKQLFITNAEEVLKKVHEK